MSAKKVRPTITVKHLGDEKALVKYYYLLLCMAAKENRATAKEETSG